MTTNSNVQNRLKQLRKELSYTQEALAKRLGIGKSALSMIETGRAALSERNKNILVQDLNVNPEWIESGEGEMFNAPQEYRSYVTQGSGAVPLQSVPLYNLEGSKGLSALLSGTSILVPVDYIHIPNMPRCDGAIYLAGEGMYPLLKSGDIVMFKQMAQLEDIFWGDMYLLSLELGGEEYITVRYLNKSERPGYITLGSINPQHGDKEIEISRILAIAFIKATIRMNSVI